MSLPNTAGGLTLNLNKYDKRQRRLLCNELRDIDAIRDRQVCPSSVRTQLSVRK